MAKAQTQRITETTFQESSLTGRVDEANGIIRGVKLLGEISKNGRRYKPSAMKEAIGLYEGRKSYVNHPKRDELGEDRPFQDWSGVFRDVRYESGNGIVGDFHLRKKGEYFDGIIEAAQKFPNDVGFSHVADGESRMESGTEIIESITEVFSVDLVTDPATTAGFFESKRKPNTIKKAIESLPDVPIRKRLLEMVDVGSLDGDAPADDAPADPLVLANRREELLISLLGETLKALAMKKDTPAPAPAATPNADPATPAADPAAPKTPAQTKPDPAQFESLQRENAELKAKNELLESGIDATPARVKALAGLTDETERKELRESWPVVESGDGERPARSPALIEAQASQVTAATFESADKFAAHYR